MTILIFLGSMIGAMALGVPIAFSLLLCGAALMWHLNMFDAQILAQNVINGADSFPLLAVPFFMLAGEIMNAGGLSRRIVNFAMALVGHVKGGLGYVTIVAAVIMASLSGSAVADAAALTALLLPMMVAAGHDKARSAGLIASAGIIAPIIPPSIGFVIFGVAANVSISKLFMAGIFPGVWLAVSLWFTWWWLVRKETIAPPPRKSFKEVLEAMRLATWALVLPFIIVFGLKFGVFTPTEAAVVAAVYSLFVSTVIYRELNLKQLVPLFVSAATTCAIVMFLVAAAMVSAWLITVANLPAQVVEPAAAAAGQPAPADAGDHGADHGGGHGAGHDAHHSAADPGADAGGEGRRDRPGVLRRAVHHQQRHRPDRAAGGHGSQCGGRRGQDGHGRSHPGGGPFHDRAVRHDVPDDRFPAAGDGAGAMVLLIP
jgi:tripartite ATP-independent transporter DctM subunit